VCGCGFSNLNLEAVVGVDVEAEDGVDFDGLGAAGRGTEFPAGKCGHDFRGHGGGAGFEDLQIFQVARCVEFAFDDDAGVRKIFREIGAKALRSSERAGMGMSVGVDFGELHHDGADGGVDVDRVVIAGKLAVEIKYTAGARGGDDGDGRAGIAFYGGASGKSRGIAVSGVKAGKIDDGAAAANVHTGRGGNSGGGGASAAGAGGGRDSGACVRVGTTACAGFS